MLDLVFRHARLIDGRGMPARRADVGVKDGKIVALGEVDERAAREIDADGLDLMPGIVDVHTHYDAQITWDPTLSPSVSLGVTTAILGNCGFGIAPCPRPLRDTMLKNLSVVEGMDLEALRQGTRWSFETFPEYLDALERAAPYANVGVLAGHSTIRTAVMGEEASARRRPSAEQLARMQAIVREALHAGAVGFASSFSPNHSGWGGRPMPSTIAEDEELTTLADELRRAGRGVFVISAGARATPEYLEAIADRTGRPAFMATVMTMYNRSQPQLALQYYERCAAALARGREVYIHANCQPLSFDFTLAEPYPFFAQPAFERVKSAAPQERASIYRDPEFRRALRSSLAEPRPGALFQGDWSQIELEGEPVTRLADDPLDFVLDLPLETRLIGKFYQNDDAGVAPLLKHPAGVIALSDAGAHLTYLCDAGYGLHFLAHWVRETGTFTLEEGVRRLTSDPARRYRIPGRGIVAPGAFADLVLFDAAGVGVSGLERVHDLPGGGARMTRRPLGVHGVWVNGQRVFDGQRHPDLEAGPGRVLRMFDP